MDEEVVAVTPVGVARDGERGEWKRDKKEGGNACPQEWRPGHPREQALGKQYQGNDERQARLIHEALGHRSTDVEEQAGNEQPGPDEERR